MSVERSNPFQSPQSVTEALAVDEKVSLESISTGILVGSLAWAPASIVSFIVTVYGIRWFNPDYLFAGAMIVLIWMCWVGTIVALASGFLVFFPVVLLARRMKAPQLLVLLLVATLLVRILPTLVIRLLTEGDVTSHGFAPWCLAPAYSCCLVFYLHQRGVLRRKPVGAKADD